MAHGGVFDTITRDTFQNIQILLPSLKEQAAIAKFLGALDDSIHLLQETNVTLEAIAQALFKSWFVDFDPVRAKQEGRQPEGMDAETAALFPDSFEQSELGEIPKGWAVSTLGNFTKTCNKKKASEELHSELKYVGLEHIPKKSLSLTQWDDASGLESSKTIFNAGDILFGKLRPYFHKVAIAPFDGVCSTDILVCQPVKSLDKGIVTMHLFSKEIINYAERLSNGAKMPRINWNDLAAFRIVASTEDISEKFSVVISPLIEQIVCNVHSSKTLSSLRDTLLPRLISGQLRLPEVDSLLEESVL